MAKQDAIVIEEFKKVTISHLKEVLMALPALIPQSEEDKYLFKQGSEQIAQMIYDLEHASDIRELGKVLDIQQIANDFDMESIRSLKTHINSSARVTMAKLTEMLDQMKEE